MNRSFSRILLVLVLLTIVILGFIFRDQLDVARIQSWVDQAEYAAPLVFVLVYAVAAVAFLPGSVLTLAGGALFGPVAGTVYNLAGATLGATLAFLTARYLASDWVAEKAQGRVKRVVEGVEAEGWRFVAFVRLVPLFPFNLLNFLLGLTRLSLPVYVAATAAFMIPGAFAYTYLGYAGREAVAGSEGLLQKGLLALALLAVVAFLPRLVSRMRLGPTLLVEELRQGLDTAEEILILDVRTREDFLRDSLGCIEGALNIPLEALQDRIGELEAWRERTIAIVCRTDRRSIKAATTLAGAGFGDVRVVRRGMTAWNEAGLPVIRPGT